MTIISTTKKLYLEDQIGQKREKEKSVSQKKQEIYISLIKKAFPRCQIANWTDINKYTSYEFHVLLRDDVDSLMDDNTHLIESLGGNREDLHIFISYLVNCWYCFSVQTSFYNGIWNFSTSHSVSRTYSTNIRKLEDELAILGYQKLKEFHVKKVIKGIDLEIVEEEKTTLFNLVFSDIVDLLK